MKRIILALWAAALLFSLLMSSCDDRFAKTNTSPNDVTDIPNEYLFATAVRQTFLSDTYVQFKFGGQYAHIYTGTSDARYIDCYFDYFTSAEYRYVFDKFYQEPIRTINKVTELTKKGGEQENEVRHAMARIVAMVNFLRLADAFGSIPYREGGQGQDNLLYPKFDSVESIYTDIISELNEKIAILKTANAKNAYPGADPLYYNDLDKWVRFANSLRLRMAMRIRFVDQQLAGTVINECMANPLIEENSQNAMIECKNSDISEFQNPLYINYNYWKWKMSKLFVDQLKNSGDPRLNVFVMPNSQHEYIGIPNGLSDSNFSDWNWEATSNPSEKLVGKAAPIYFMSAAEIWLLRAEAALAGIIPGNSNDLFRKGIGIALEQWNVNQNEADAFLQSATATLSGTQEQRFAQICTQLWIAYMPDTFEAWCNIRRTGYPKIEKRNAPEFEPGVSGGILPKRFRYPAIESSINHENYLKAIEQQGPDQITTALWWDVRD